MKRTFAEAMAHRRSYYSIGSDSSVLGIDGTTGFVLEFVERKLGVKP